jgi:hypothetical protein
VQKTQPKTTTMKIAGLLQQRPTKSCACSCTCASFKIHVLSSQGQAE